MNFSQKLQDWMQYVTEAFVLIFAPNDDQYPYVGIQPFEGDPLSRRSLVWFRVVSFFLPKTKQHQHILLQ